VAQRQGGWLAVPWQEAHLMTLVVLPAAKQGLVWRGMCSQEHVGGLLLGAAATRQEAVCWLTGMWLPAPTSCAS
jgi:hypothetical protein